MGVLLALLSACGFASLGFFVKELYARGFTSSDALAWRFIVSAAVLWGYLGLRRRIPFDGRGFVRAFALGLFGFATQAAIYFSTVKFLSVSLAGLLLYTYPAFVVLIAWALWHRRPRAREVGGVTFALVGAALVLSPELGGVSPLGLGLGVACGVWYAFYLSVSERLLRDVNAVLSTAAVSLGCAVAFSFNAFVLQGGLRLPQGAVELGLCVSVALVCTVVPIATLFAAIHRMGAPRAALVSTFEVPATVIFGVAFFGERLLPLQWMGGALVLAAIGLVTRREP